MKTTLRQRLLIAVGLSAGLLASMNLFAQNTQTFDSSGHKYTISSQADYFNTIESINELANSLHKAHQKYPNLTYSHVYDSNGALMGFTVNGVPQSSGADEISACLMQLEVLGNAVRTMDYAYLPDSKNKKLNSRISRKKARESEIPAESEEEVTIHVSSANPDDLISRYE